jgi:ribosomal protein L3 glutamine methyltransferase
MSSSENSDRIEVGTLIQRSAKRLLSAGVWFGHGTDNAVDEAAELIFFACGLSHEDAPAAYSHVLTPDQRKSVETLIQRRIDERVPAAYLTGRMWFAGHEFHVDARVLVPRSPLAEIILADFQPWIGAGQIRRIIDIGTGSGCIAIACALALPETSVDAADISPDALAVARMNVERHQVTDRVRLVQSDVYAGLGPDDRYDLIISNPPYVGSDELRSLPEEYAREPRIGLYGGDDGLDIVRRILRGASERLQPQGLLIVEVGNSDEALAQAMPNVPFTWLEFANGGGGVFVLTADEVRTHRASFA